jgi:hypothetical protein
MQRVGEGKRHAAVGRSGALLSSRTDRRRKSNSNRVTSPQGIKDAWEREKESHHTLAHGEPVPPKPPCEKGGVERASGSTGMEEHGAEVILP